MTSISCDFRNITDSLSILTMFFPFFHFNIQVRMNEPRNFFFLFCIVGFDNKKFGFSCLTNADLEFFHLCAFCPRLCSLHKKTQGINIIGLSFAFLSYTALTSHLQTLVSILFQFLRCFHISKIPVFLISSLKKVLNFYCIMYVRTCLFCWGPIWPGTVPGAADTRSSQFDKGKRLTGKIHNQRQL